MPRFAAERVLLAPGEDVWAFVAEPYHLSSWFPGVAGVQPDRRGLSAGARWRIQGAGMFRHGVPLLVTDVVPGRRFAFEVPGRRRFAFELELVDHGGRWTRATCVMHTGSSVLRSRVPQEALKRLFDLVQTAAV